MNHWEMALVATTSSLQEAITSIDRSALRIALITDESRHLLGTLTDGDVRRAMLSHVPLNTPVTEVMCPTPLVAQRDWSRDRILAVMEARQLLQLPVVDEDNRVIGLETLHGLLDKRTLPNPVFLMAGGLGSRLHPLTQDCPKPMLKVGEKPILERILEGFVAAGFHRFFISTHDLPGMVREHFGDGSRWGVSIQYTHEEHPLGTAGALGLLPHAEIDVPVLMMNGDLLTSLNYRELLDFHVSEGATATMGVREYEHQVPYGVVQGEGHLIQSMVEKPVHKYFVNAGVYVLSPALVKSVKLGTRVDMPALLQESIAGGRKVVMFPVQDYWLDIGRMEDFHRAQIDVASLRQ